MSPALKEVARSAQLSTMEFYNTHAREYSEATLHVDLRDLYGRFLTELSPRAHILDAGCGSGRDTEAFLSRGFRVTSIDASPQLAALASAFTGIRCEILRFQQMEFKQEFDGIWACASILHVPRTEIDDVMFRFIRALKPVGTLYVSLKEGDGERTAEDGRFFSYYTADSFRKLLKRFPALQEVAFWKTEERRSSTHCECWLSFLLRKVKQ